jgi:hypothetical protein
VTDADYVTVSDFQVQFPTSQFAYVTGSSHVTIDRLLGEESSSTDVDTSVPGFEITGNSSSVTLSRNEVYDYVRRAPTIQVDAGSTDDVITTNGILGGSPPIAVTGAPDTDVTSNTIVEPFDDGWEGTGIDLAGASTGSYVENNILIPGLDGAWPQTSTALLAVGTAATPGTTVDYNVLDFAAPEAGEAYYAYQWGSLFYSTTAAFTAATGQAAHDLFGAPDIYTGAGFSLDPSPGNSSAINTANSAAPGELATDISGQTRTDDPLFPETGAGPYSYYDRGAAQIRPGSAADVVTASAVGTLGVTATSQNWSSTGYSFNFGDGTGAVDGAYGTAEHTYAQPGTYTVTVSGTSSVTGEPFTDSTTFTTTALSGGELFHIGRLGNGTWWSGWDEGPSASANIAQAAITAMPDGDTQIVAVTTGGILEHTIYDSANGNWQSWGLPKNNATAVSASIAGMPNGSSQIIEVTSTGTLEHTIRNANGSWQSSGWGSPAGSTGIVEAAITAMPNGSSQLVAVTTGGVLEHDIRGANGSWQSTGWGVPAQTDLAAAVTSSDIAGLADGSSQVIEVSTN